MRLIDVSMPTRIRLVKPIKVDRDIPLPVRRIGHGTSIRTYKYPFALMRVGDSFFVAHGKYDVVGASARQFGGRYGCRFTTRKVDGGCRCWRIE